MKQKYMDEDEIIKFIEDYIQNVKIDYAILLDGTWGNLIKKEDY